MPLFSKRRTKNENGNYSRGGKLGGGKKSEPKGCVESGTKGTHPSQYRREGEVLELKKHTSGLPRVREGKLRKRVGSQPKQRLKRNLDSRKRRGTQGGGKCCLLRGTLARKGKGSSRKKPEGRETQQTKKEVVIKEEKKEEPDHV